MAGKVKPNVIKILGDGVAEVQLTKGLVSLVDENCLEILTRLKWEINTCGYVFSIRSQGRIRMHRFLLGLDKNGLGVDHINRNKLDNRLSNLRLCTQAQNVCNRAGHGSKSVFKGVSRKSSTAKWRANIKCGEKNLYLGTFATEIQAAIAYDKAARVYYGEFAYQNFPTIDLHASHNHDDCMMERNAMCGNQ